MSTNVPHKATVPTAETPATTNTTETPQIQISKAFWAELEKRSAADAKAPATETPRPRKFAKPPLTEPQRRAAERAKVKQEAAKVKRDTALYKQKVAAAKAQKATLQEWAEKYCMERGFSLDFAIRHGAWLVTEAQARAERYKPAGAGIVFEKYNLAGERVEGAGSLRYQHPPKIGGQEKPPKFMRRINVASAPSFAVLGWELIAKNVDIPVVIAEGPTRALAGAKHGIAVIALDGCDNGFVGGTKGGELVESLKAISWKRGKKRRTVFLALDGDVKINANVRRAQERLATALTALGAEVRILEMPRIGDGHEGLDDVLARDYGVKLFHDMCEAATLWSATPEAGDVPVLRSLSDVANEEVDYIWNDRIARGCVMMFSGDPGSAKTFLGLSIAADLTRGRIPASSARCKPLRVLYATTENSAEHVIGPRFRAMGGDDTKLKLLDGATDAKGNSTGITFADLAPVERAVEKLHIDLLVFDPVQSYFGADADFHKANEVRPRMDNLMRLAAKHNIAIVLIRHLAKASGGRAIHRGLGSVDFTGAVRIELLVGSEADKPNSRAVMGVKNNLGILAPSLAFTIEGSGMNAKLVWKGASQLRAADLLAPEATKSRSGRARATEYLREQLASGPKPLSRLVTEEFNKRMLQRSAKLMGIDRGRKLRGDAVYALPGVNGRSVN